MPPAQVNPAVQAVQLAAVAEQVEDVVKLEKNPALQRQPARWAPSPLQEYPAPQTTQLPVVPEQAVEIVEIET